MHKGSFLDNLSKQLTEKESGELFTSGQTIDSFCEIAIRHAKKYGIKPPLTLRLTVTKHFNKPGPSLYGRGPKRISIYIYPHMEERIEWLAKKAGLTKRLTFLQVINLGLQQMEESWGTMEKYSHGRK